MKLSFLSLASALAMASASICLSDATTSSATTMHGQSTTIMSRYALAGSAPAFGPEKHLPNAKTVTHDIAASVNVAKWPKFLTPPDFSFNSQACVDGKNVTGKAYCRYGDPSGKHTIVTFGDSHSAMWIPAISILAKQKHMTVDEFELASCGAPDFPQWNNETNSPYTACTAFRKKSFAAIAKIKPEVVFISGQFRGLYTYKNGQPDKSGTEAAWEKGLAKTIKILKESAKRVVVIGDIGYSEQQPVDCLTSHESDVRACNTSRPYAEDVAHNKAEKATAHKNGAQYIYTVNWMCTRKICPAVIDGIPTHIDREHVTATLVLWLRGVFAQAAHL
jgi:hypothetical protein